jgi:hypothetical protein
LEDLMRWFQDPPAEEAVKSKHTENADLAAKGIRKVGELPRDVLAVLRGPEHTPLPDDEIKDKIRLLSTRMSASVRSRARSHQSDRPASRIAAVRRVKPNGVSGERDYRL